MPVHFLLTRYKIYACVEKAYLGDLAGLMIASQDGDALTVTYLKKTTLMTLQV